MSVLQRGWPLLLLVCGVARGAEPDSDVHLGVASCAASVCHGK